MKICANYKREERATLLAIAREFQKVFENLKLGIGADRVESAKNNQLSNNKQDAPSKLLVVQWDQNALEAQIRGPAYFFAPRPLLNHLWSASDVKIYPYVPGQPLRPDPEPEPPAYQLTNFSSEDLERWAETLLARIDRVLLPDFAPHLRRFDAETYQDLIDAKYAIANAVAARVDLILEPESSDPSAPKPDVSSAQEQLRQQLLSELNATHRGGVVVQYDVDATAPSGKWTPSQAPRLLCCMAPKHAVIEGDEPTLDSLAAQFGTSTQLIAMTLQDLQNILQVGKKIPLGSEPKINETDSLSTLAERAGLTLKALVEGLHDRKGYLASGAGIPLSVRSYVAEIDDTFGSILEHLASNLTSRGLIDYAIEILDGTTGDTPGIFLDGIKLKVENNGKTSTHKTTFEDTIRSVAKVLGLDVVTFQYQRHPWLQDPCHGYFPYLPG